MSLRGDVAARLIRARVGYRGEGPGHPDRGNQYHTGTTGGGVSMGGSKSGGKSKSGGAHAFAVGVGGIAMSAAIEALGDGSDSPVDMTADALAPPTELGLGDLERYVEGHGDLWDEEGAHLVATIDKKRKKVVATVVKLTPPSASATSRSLPPPVHPVEFAAMGRRSVTHGLFPRAWGPPPHELRAREAWILEHCEAEARGDVSTLVELRSRYLQLSIRARRYSPGEI